MKRLRLQFLWLELYCDYDNDSSAIIDARDAHFSYDSACSVVFHRIQLRETLWEALFYKVRWFGVSNHTRRQWFPSNAPLRWHLPPLSHTNATNLKKTFLPLLRTSSLNTVLVAVWQSLRPSERLRTPILLPKRGSTSPLLLHEHHHRSLRTTNLPLGISPVLMGFTVVFLLQF